MQSVSAPDSFGANAPLPRQRAPRRVERGAEPPTADVPAPAIPMLAAPFTWRVLQLDGDDVARVAEWMSRPHLVQTWEQDWESSRWYDDAKSRLAQNYSRPCIIELDRRPIGYGEVYRVAQDEVGELYNIDDFDTEFHVAIGELDVIGRGIMSAMIAELAPAIFAADPSCRRVIVDPDCRNTRMHRVLDKADLHRLGTVDARPDRRIVLYAGTRTVHDLPTLSVPTCE